MWCVFDLCFESLTPRVLNLAYSPNTFTTAIKEIHLLPCLANKPCFGRADYHVTSPPPSDGKCPEDSSLVDRST